MSFEQELEQKIKSNVKMNEPMSLHTSWQVGGPADYFVCPDNISEIVEIVRLSAKYNIPLYIIGNGSNLLVLDGGIRGLVINIGQSFCYINRIEKGLIAGAGTAMTMLAKTAVEYGLTGIEFAVGIPGSLGGAVIMNAGAFGGYIGEQVKSVKVIAPDGEVKILSNDELVFGYRTSSLVGKGIVIEIELELAIGDKEQSRSQMEHFLSERRRRHPSLPSCGSVFRNLPGNPAGQLIENAGGKGLRIGGAEVSTQHANFIVNTGTATAADILATIDSVKKLVKEKYNIELRPEVKIIGEED
ncbi:MAG: UDP-N-acetylmuramate dehydrogenase [Dethiobacteria bacterium]|nr:UDP-N-acetylmuramate dehydrogenase [Bacillota bacterium]MDW7728561.1 UDP-N-acetylmuramate dehydrogenase [Bacillota bacterium]